jgi:ribosome-associated translation inhibitor RaiA
MKIQFRPRGVTLSKAQRVRLERDLDMVLGRFSERIDRVIVEITDDREFKLCAIEVRLKPQIVKAEHAETNVFVALEHAAKRVARSVSRVIETRGLVGR